MNNAIIMLINSICATDIRETCKNQELEVIIEDGVITDVIRKEKN